MTTVIATPKGIYADTRCSYTVPFKVSKIVRAGLSVYAGTGDLDDVTRFFEWRRKGGKLKDAPSFVDDLDILEVCADGIFIWGKKLVRLKVDEVVYSFGSGSQYAMGAVAMGAGPEQAIEIAAMFDPQTALPIEFVKVKKSA